MATLDYDEIKPKKFILVDDEPFEILESHVARTQKRKPQNQVRMRSCITGKVMPGTFHASDTAEEADISRGEAKFLFEQKGEFWFCDPNDPAKRFQIPSDVIGTDSRFLQPNTIIDTSIFELDDEPKVIGIKLPVKMVFEVREAPPSIKGNTSSGGNKLCTIDTGAQILTPLFIETGERIVVNTLTGEYTERFKA